MALTLPANLKRTLLQRNAKETWLWAFELVIPGQTTKRYIDNLEDVVYDSDTFEKQSIKIGQQELSSEGTLPRIVLMVSNINRAMEDIINDSEGAVGGTVKVIKINDQFLDTPIPALEFDYDVMSADSDSDWVTITVGIPNLLTQRFPIDQYSSSMCSEATPSRFKGPKCKYAGGDTTCNGTLLDCISKSNQVNWNGELGLDPDVAGL